MGAKSGLRYELEELEKHFVVVNWDQPGSGKSYSALPRSELTPETYIEDGYALTQYLRNEFEQEKIYLVGESWGSALGIFLVERYPPYYGKDVVWKSATYLNYRSGIMARNPEIRNAGFNTFRDLAAQEYGVMDKINFLRGIVNSFSQVYPQLYSIDMRVEYHTLQVPIYFFLGRHDINAPTSLVEEYYEQLNAPHKEIICFEHSGHSPWINESNKFIQEIVRIANS